MKKEKTIKGKSCEELKNSLRTTEKLYINILKRINIDINNMKIGAIINNDDSKPYEEVIALINDYIIKIENM